MVTLEMLLMLGMVTWVVQGILVTLVMPLTLQPLVTLISTAHAGDGDTGVPKIILMMWPHGRQQSQWRYCSHW